MIDAAQLFETHKINASSKQIRLLQAYVSMLLDENTRQNLTAVKTEEEVWKRHILDAAMLLPYFEENLNATVIDLGTGGGVPGIPLAILRPLLQITLLDSEQSKIRFCERAAKSLGLQIDAICGRAEELAHLEAYRCRFDFAVSRAMASGSMLCELAVPMLKVGGALISMKGRNYDPAAERFAEAAVVLGAEVTATDCYTLFDEKKHMIVCRKNAVTPAQYPRRFAKIKRSPL